MNEWMKYGLVAANRAFRRLPVRPLAPADPTC